MDSTGNQAEKAISSLKLGRVPCHWFLKHGFLHEIMQNLFEHSGENHRCEGFPNMCLRLGVPIYLRFTSSIPLYAYYPMHS